MLLQTLFSPLVLVWFEGPSLIHSDSHFLYTDSWSHILKPDSEMTVKEPRFCFRLLVLGAMVGLPFTTTISQKKKIAGSNPRRGFYLLILVCFFSVQHSYVTLVVLVSAR